MRDRWFTVVMFYKLQMLYNGQYFLTFVRQVGRYNKSSYLDATLGTFKLSMLSF